MPRDLVQFPEVETPASTLPIGHQRLLRLAEFLDTVPPKRFNISFWADNQNAECGTAACAVGWATTIPEFREAGLHLVTLDDPINGRFIAPMYGRLKYMDAAAEFFGIPLATAIHLFFEGSYKWIKVGPDTVAARIRAWLPSPEAKP